MTNRTNDGSGNFYMEGGDGTNTRIIRADNETDFLREMINQLIEDYDAMEKVTAKVTKAADGYSRVEVTFANMTEKDWDGIGTDFDHAFTGKGWYECREEGGNQDGTKRWWVVKHNGGPWF